MNLKHLATGVVITAIMSMLVVTILVPTVTESASSETTFVNPSEFNYGYFDGDDYTLELSPEGLVKAQGQEIQLPRTQYSLVAADSFVLRYGWSSGQGYYFQAVSETLHYGVKSLSYSNGTLTVVTSDDQTRSFGDIGSFYAIVEEHDTHVCKSATESAYVNGDTDLYGTGLTSAGGQWFALFHFQGTINEGIEVECINFDYSISNVVVHYSEVNGYNDLYLLDSITFDITSGADVVHANYSYFVVPSEVTAEKTLHADDSTRTMIGLIPVLVLAGLVIGVVGSFIRNRD